VWKFYTDQVVRRCVLHDEFHFILTFYHSHSCGGHFGAKRTVHKVFESGFTDLLFLRMHITFANHVKNAKQQAISLIRIKCL
jgi:hypothetical protein